MGKLLWVVGSLALIALSFGMLSGGHSMAFAVFVAGFVCLFVSAIFK